jgi:hypothetical protein
MSTSRPDNGRDWSYLSYRPNGGLFYARFVRIGGVGERGCGGIVFVFHFSPHFRRRGE